MKVETAKTKRLKPDLPCQPECHAFLRSLDASGLVTPGIVEQLRLRYQKQGFDAAVELAIEENWLTHYQLKRICEGEPEGLILGQYRILDELGRGGFGQVFKAVHTMMDRVTALKVIAPGLLLDKKVRSLFLREVLASTRLVHPNIAFAYDANEINSVLFLALEYIDGLNLEQFVIDQGPLSEAQACVYMLQTAQALQFAHEHGMVHRDIKPANILLPGTKYGTESAAPSTSGVVPLVKVVDFGLARLHPPSASRSHTIDYKGGTLGTPAFMSPEQARDFHEVDIRSDLYSLGCTFYYALSGLVPFDAPTAGEIFVAHMERTPQHLARLRPDLSLNFIAIVHRLLAKRPERRFQTPAELVKELSYCLRLGWLQKNPDAIAEPEAMSSETGRENLSPASALAGRQPVQAEVRPQPPVSAKPGSNEMPVLLSGHSFSALFEEWCALIECLLRQGRQPIDESYYKSLHRSLLTAANDQDTDGSPEQYNLREQAKMLVEPWISLNALADLDRTTLTSLWNQCLGMHGQLTPATKPAATASRIACFIAIVVVLCMFGLFATATHGSTFRSLERVFVSGQSFLILSGVAIASLLALPLFMLFRKRA